jgi:ABC-type bacteriocin/lantibiotic exporter with double-glycine peptidase domain
MVGRKRDRANSKDTSTQYLLVVLGSIISLLSYVKKIRPILTYYECGFFDCLFIVIILLVVFFSSFRRRLTVG